MLHVRLASGAGVIVTAHGLAKTLDRLAHIAAQALEALGTKQQEYDQQYDHQLPDSNATHCDYSCKAMKRKDKPASRR
ncbi:hypothetical protein D3C77_755390 [compost metagenome]